MQLKPGLRLRSAVSSTEVIVIRCPAGDVDLTCAGRPMAGIDDPAPETVDDSGEQNLMGKRYVDVEGDLELLVTKPGGGLLAVGGTGLVLQTPKPLPSTD